MSSYWVGQNEDAFITRKADFLEREWKKSVDIAQNGGAVILTVGREHVGTVISAELLQSYYEFIPDVSDHSYDSLRVLKKEDLTPEFELYSMPLDSACNVLIVDENDVPVVGIVNKLFSVELDVQEDGKVRFGGNLGEVIHDGVAPLSEQEAQERFDNFS